MHPLPGATLRQGSTLGAGTLWKKERFCILFLYRSKYWLYSKAYSLKTNSVLSSFTSCDLLDLDKSYGFMGLHLGVNVLHDVGFAVVDNTSTPLAIYEATKFTDKKEHFILRTL